MRWLWRRREFLCFRLRHKKISSTKKSLSSTGQLAKLIKRVSMKQLSDSITNQNSRLEPFKPPLGFFGCELSWHFLALQCKNGLQNTGRAYCDVKALQDCESYSCSFKDATFCLSLNGGENFIAALQSNHKKALALSISHHKDLSPTITTSWPSSARWIRFSRRLRPKVQQVRH
jgi:hypothetical protein